MPYAFRDDIATADVAFDAWGDTREAMFAAAAGALLATQVEEPETVVRRIGIPFACEADAVDLLLHAFLQELVFLSDARRMLLHADDIRIEGEEGGWHARAVARGEPIDRSRHPLGTDVKAVTLHRLGAAFEDGAWRATVVLDV